MSIGSTRRFKKDEYKPKKLVDRYPPYPQVILYTNCIGQILSHLKWYSKTEEKDIKKAFRSINQIVYSFYRKSLLENKPDKEIASLDELLRHNDSVAHLREIYKRFVKESFNGG
jgi:hypothetical protein